MSLSEEQTAGQTNILEGKSIVISGVFTHYSRDEYKALIEQHGGKNVGSISGKTSFILAGDNMGPSKLQKAEKLGVQIVSEEEFLEMIKDEGTVSPPALPRREGAASPKTDSNNSPIQLDLFS